MKIEIRDVKTQEELNQAIQIRKEVFVKEQNVPDDQELDNFDDINNDQAIHFLIIEDEKTIGTARAIFRGDSVQLGRVCILEEYRGQGIGNQLINHMCEYLFDTCEIEYIYLEAQIKSVPFYEKLGFTISGDEFKDENRNQIRIKMVKKGIN